MRWITEKQQRKNKKTKSWCFEKIQQTDKPLAGLTNKRTEKIQITKLRNQRGDVTTGLWNIFLKQWRSSAQLCAVL